VAFEVFESNVGAEEQIRTLRAADPTHSCVRGHEDELIIAPASRLDRENTRPAEVGWFYNHRVCM
jgi:hypothetical protein